MKIVIHQLLWVFLYLFCSAAYAETQWYVVEMIVFAQPARSNETFDQAASRIDWPSRMVELGARPLPLADLKLAPEAYVPLQSADRGLNTAYQTLQLQGGYQPLLHSAWVQPVDSASENPALHIHSGGGSGAGNILNGFVQLESRDRLYLRVDLKYTPFGSAGQATGYRLREKRGIQLDAVHYFDHPKFGVICRVSSLR